MAFWQCSKRNCKTREPTILSSFKYFSALVRHIFGTPTTTLIRQEKTSRDRLDLTDKMKGQFTDDRALHTSEENWEKKILNRWEKKTLKKDGGGGGEEVRFNALPAV